jgi:cytochrome b561
LPALLPDSDAAKALLSNLHLWLSWLLVALIALHVAAALKHALVDRDGVLRRLLPGPGARPAPRADACPGGRRG